MVVLGSRPIHPFEVIPRGRMRWLAAPLLLLLVVSAAWAAQTLPWREDATLAELVAAGSMAEAEAIVARWSPGERHAFAFFAGLDLLLDLAWFNLVALACIAAARRSGSPAWLRAGARVAWLAWLAALLNLPENRALERLIAGHADGSTLAVLHVCTSARGFLLVATAAFPPLVLVWTMAGRRGRTAGIAQAHVGGRAGRGGGSPGSGRGS